MAQGAYYGSFRFGELRYGQILGTGAFGTVELEVQTRLSQVLATNQGVSLVVSTATLLSCEVAIRAADLAASARDSMLGAGTREVDATASTRECRVTVSEVDGIVVALARDGSVSVSNRETGLTTGEREETIAVHHGASKE